MSFRKLNDKTLRTLDAASLSRGVHGLQQEEDVWGRVRHEIRRRILRHRLARQPKPMKGDQATARLQSSSYIYKTMFLKQKLFTK